MSMRRSDYWRCAGITLIEVIAGLVILATLAVSLLAAKEGFLHQWGSAERRLIAVQAADRMLSEWWQNIEQFPRGDEGVCPEDATLKWRTSVLVNEMLESLETQIVRLEIFDSTALTQPQVLVLVDTVVPIQNRLLGSGQ